MPRSRLPRLASITDGSFEPSKRNPISLRNDEPLDSNLKQLKVGENTTPLELSEDELRVNGNIFVNGKFKSNKIETIGGQYLDLIGSYIRMYTPSVESGKETEFAFATNGALVVDIKNSFNLDADTDMTFKANGDDFHFYGGGSNAVDLYFRFDINNYCLLNVADSGVTTLSTIDADGTGGHLTLDIDGSLIFDPADGKYIAKSNGTEFSAANSAYAGMILGYTRLEGDLTNQNVFEIQNAITVEDDTHKVTFTTPPSEYVEIEIQVMINRGTTDTTITCGLSDADASTGYNSIGAQYEYDYLGIGFNDDEVDDYLHIVKWVLPAAELAAIGSSNTFWIGFGTGGSTKSAWITYGLRATHGIATAPFIIKATALPETIYDGQ